MFIFELIMSDMLSRFKSERTGATAALLIDGSIVDDNIDGTNKFNYQCVSTLV